jgi:hypothetical protein
MDRLTVVATAAPMTPRRGNGPSPKIRQGREHDVQDVREPQRAHRGGSVACAPEDRVHDEEEEDGHVRAQHDRGVGRPVVDDLRRRAHRAEQAWGERPARDTEEDGSGEGAQEHLKGRGRGGIEVLLADAPRDERRGAGREPHRESVDGREHRLGESHRGDGIRAEPRHEDDVDDGEERLHRHLEDGGHGEEDDRATDRDARQILRGAADRLEHGRPDGRVLGSGHSVVYTKARYVPSSAPRRSEPPSEDASRWHADDRQVERTR